MGRDVVNMGKLHFFDTKEEWEQDQIDPQELAADMENHLVDSGKAFLADIVRGTYWTTSETRYLRLGTLTDTNAGVVGPTSGAAVPSAGAWQGIANTDWHLSNDITETPVELTAVRTGKTIFFYGMITDVNVVSGLTTDYDIYEAGIYIGSGVADNDPVQHPTTQNTHNAMVARMINMYESGAYYVALPKSKAAGAELPFRYEFAYFER